MDPKEKDKGYSVGYKKPPQHTQFKPGQSGNPKGRPKKVPTTSDLFLKESLSRVPIITKDGRRHMISKMQAIAKQFATKAANGDYKAARLVLEQLNSGKPDSGDNLANLIQEFRLANSRLEAADSDQRPAAQVKSRKRK